MLPFSFSFQTRKVILLDPVYNCSTDNVGNLTKKDYYEHLLSFEKNYWLTSVAFYLPWM